MFGTRGILAGLLFIAIGFVIGWLLGGPAEVTGGSWPWAPRNATLPPRRGGKPQSFSDPKVVVMVVVVAIVSLLILMPLSRMLAERD